jgi:benzylsuccinate CoA-transferase BbsF subunit
MGAGAVLTALAYRRRTGKGQYIDLSEQEAAIPVMGAALMEYQMNARVPERRGNRSDWAAPQGCYRCAGDDRWVVISCGNDAEFERLAGAIGRTEWLSDERFATVLARHQHHDELDAAITEWTSQRDHYGVMHTLQAAGIKAAAVLNGKEAMLDPQFTFRQQYDIVEQPHLGKRPVQKNVAARFTRFETTPRRHAPTLGEHNDEVLKELGYTDEQIAEMYESRKIAAGPHPQIPPALISMALKLPYEKFVEAGIIQSIEPDYREQLGIASGD